ncbi:NAD(P)-binding protein [Exidia glandulosa HHB12029]|uniref:NAD(P)-binding protein n=1 Tax=Exidia glandulosa HHB12029 TaxID=1314781 RepID=A0A166B9H4_EXIGL|nr:NAD(P)-binding protein [Exidia glandulosa HHB12029]
MPALTAPAKILVTGATGFIAVHTVKAYLTEGFTVRGTVRSAARGDFLRSLFDKDFPGKFEYVVADIEKPEELDAAVKGVDGIAHLASPFYIPSDNSDPQDLIRPAVNGTVHVLESAAKAGAQNSHSRSGIKRIVITSSIVSILQPQPDSYIYSVRDWNEAAISDVQEKGRKASGFMKYVASKVMAEKAALKWVQENKPGFDVGFVLPTYVYGPILGDSKSVDTLPTTPQRLLGFFANGVENVNTFVGSYIHVEDVARAHVAVHLREDLGNNRRLLLSSTNETIGQDYYDAYWSLPEDQRPKLPFPIPKGTARSGNFDRDGNAATKYENAEEVLGWKFIGLTETVRSTLAAIAAKVLAAE